ncbi:ATP-dependent helicase HrpB [Shewanella sp. AS16]|uniref:ATP-dependent helicase HrpB n=1 Tax=Shewanella sp. AS16 TaxID=2907625 RepID=UPI001F1C75FB|nr:ATP-dependent helicase HrpB [Shewanella sp. AS16]MCE9685765.1 ATP-dependent helicase HrpB [Shewanella sp. AS16]
MNQLPIHALLPAIREALAHHDQVILEAPTGAGKSTALPLAMLDWPEIAGRILMLEPRRVATRSVAQFIAERRGQCLGQEVGFRIRGESRVGCQTRLEIVTEGILTRMIQQDPELKGVGVIIFDEIHERHLTTDLGLALALEVQASLRDDLKILAMSATLSGLPLAELMPEAKSLSSEGRSFPVAVDYRPVKGQQAWLEHMGRCVLELLGPDSPVPAELAAGSLLAFLPGKAEILRLAEFLGARLDGERFSICPLYGELSPQAQDKAIAPAPAGRRKLVLATNVAESSLTIEGISLVVDSGYRRHAGFNPRTGVSRLALKRISQASATQRSGRAGRLAPGYCLRLWSQEEHDRMPKADEPEILHSDLLPMVLDCAFWGARSLQELTLLTAPPKVHETLGWELLTQLELVDARRKITPLGQAAHRLGCHPRLAHMLLKAKLLAEKQRRPELATLACLLAGVLEARGLPRRGADIGGYLALACQGQTGSQVRSWQQKLKLGGALAEAVSHAGDQDIGLLLALAYPDRIAKARGVDGYQLANGTGVSLAPEDALAGHPWLVIADFQQTEGRTAGRVYLAGRFDVTLLERELDFLVTRQQECGWDEAKGRFYAERQAKVGQILLSTQAIANLDRSQIVAAILAQLRRKGLGLLNWDESVTQLQLRLALVGEHYQDQDWPSLTDEALLASLESWLAPYLTQVNNLAQLARIDCHGLLRNLMSWEQQQKLDALLPTSWPMATGTRARIHYDANGRALLSVRLQEALGMSQSPMLAQGKIPVTMTLLSPAQRPLAVTADLASFWQGPYHEVKKEMRGRYPKHLWPDDPANTLPTKFTKKKTLASGAASRND